MGTNIGGKFLAIIDECIPKGHPLHKIINRNTVKVSYRCMPNMGQILAKHNSKIRNGPTQRTPLAATAEGDPLHAQ